VKTFLRDTRHVSCLAILCIIFTRVIGWFAFDVSGRTTYPSPPPTHPPQISDPIPRSDDGATRPQPHGRRRAGVDVMGSQALCQCVAFWVGGKLLLVLEGEVRCAMGWVGVVSLDLSTTTKIDIRNRVS